MRSVQLESFIKSFLLFATSMGILISTLFYLNYTKEIQSLDATLFSEMRVCSYDLKCEQFNIDFVPKQKQVNYTLYKEDGLSAYFPITDANEYVMQLHLSAAKYAQHLTQLQHEAYWQFSVTLFIIFILSALFSFYTLYPLRNALELTQEFIKDILHDFNTPLGALRLNSAMLKREVGDNPKVLRIEQSVQNILDLQENLRAYLFDHQQQKEYFSLRTLMQERVTLLEKTYETIQFEIKIDDVKLYTNRAAFQRIIDNLLSNAAKYNRKNGNVQISYDAKKQMLSISDTGKGIKEPKRVFQRFYKEQERGIGIGLHIVQKLCDELKITIRLTSILHEGSTFTLSLNALTHR